MISLNVNGSERRFDGDPAMPLLWYLRDVLGMTGTKFGCGIAQCGACTVHVDGKPVRSCLLPEHLSLAPFGEGGITPISAIGGCFCSDAQRGYRVYSPGIVRLTKFTALRFYIRIKLISPIPRAG